MEEFYDKVEERGLEVNKPLIKLLIEKKSTMISIDDVVPYMGFYGTSHEQKLQTINIFESELKHFKNEFWEFKDNQYVFDPIIFTKLLSRSHTKIGQDNWFYCSSIKNIYKHMQLEK